MHNYKLTIEYNGKYFYGWQKQKDLISVQSVIEQAIYRLCSVRVSLICAGRTDTGVHAVGQVANFLIDKKLDTYRLQEGINFHIKKITGSTNQVIILDAQEVPLDFHARFSAISRRYKYQIINRRSYLTIYNDFYWHVRYKLNIQEMQKASSYFRGQHDFSSFRASTCQSKNPVKNIKQCYLEYKNELIEFHVEANAFLHHQVRNMIGTIVEVGKGCYTSEHILQLIAIKDRKLSGQTAPAKGLFLMEVKYGS